MFAKLFTFLAVLAVAFAAPKAEPKAKPSPQLLTYTYPGSVGYTYPAAAVPAYTAPLAYSAYPAYYVR